jgi:predicted MFS family arabinose efflux permease
VEGPGRDADFRRFWLASAISEFGTPVTTVAVQVLVVVTLHGTATDVGLVTSARWLPYLAVGLVVGVVADRVRRRPVLVATDVLRFALLASVPVLVHLGVLGIGGLALFMAAFGLASLLNEAAHQAFLPRIVAPGHLPLANARLGQAASAAHTVGPVAGGGVVAWLGAPLAVLVDAVSYLVSAALTARIRVEEPSPAVSTGSRAGAFVRELREGLRWVYRHPMLLPFAVTSHVWFLFFGIASTVYAPFVLARLGLGPAALGVTLALTGVGGLVGNSLSGRLATRAGVAGTVATAHALSAAGVALVALTPAGPGVGTRATVALLCAAQFVVGVGLSVGNPVEMGYRQAVTPDRLQGRTNTTIRSVNRAAVVVGAPLGGVLADTAGYRPALWVAAAGLAATAAAVALSPLRHARADDRPPASAGAT